MKIELQVEKVYAVRDVRSVSGSHLTGSLAASRRAVHILHHAVVNFSPWDTSQSKKMLVSVRLSQVRSN